MNLLLVSNEYSKPGRIGNPIIYRIQDALKADDKVTSVVFVPFKNHRNWATEGYINHKKIKEYNET